ncbi:hypothetical protein A3A14_04555 [Candidatus Daviesbacteria bacterium RIFCSPLOWO2_01_FULL_43_38]|uniref:Glycosyltransferase 2-like domain-containing protein n=3 Tax=Candidatus Daviesiibacteriota TaxID=1752718 RepID=A0A1F5K053_9BACT|nr:MAG: Glycosyl transferase, family 2 [Candidatus Daviesbacteria bacterium GW2011_GWA1_42_6]OGE34292.1 MAG: hypothetical protein A3E45_04900 [Candidatus Daviesbacteria bacterium RIFCSPHIGHO2_12_FULL_43_11]OGE63802.1 MAG: hypothetical protein A3A14_04555 [Candidatus Daviesbacteria bacterium RIFCSPLOWO2_01_FULL_43_38]OGE69099.1 MAG: hypothetical protein A3J21_00605 [Candidatus Daviesbacteria bacterium RIFCSPLOWO2_02_FULL_43_11]
MKISIVIPYWNGAEKIKKHLPGVLEFAGANKVEEIVASDDASTDETVNLLKSEFPEVVVVERKKNEGFASNVNTGFAHAKGDIIFLLNSDASAGMDVLRYALPHFEDPKVFSVGCNVGGLWSVGYFKDGFFRHDQARQTTSGEAKYHRTLWTSGGSSIFRKSLWDEIGGLDELYNPFYVEDVDLGYRATKRGYINIWEPRSRVEHYKEKGVIESNFTRSTISSTSERNMLIFVWKNITDQKMMSEHRMALAKRLVQHPKYWSVFMDALRRLPATLAKREIEKKAAKLSDEEVFSLFHGEKD